MAIEITTEVPVVPETTDRIIAYRPAGVTPEEKTVVILAADFMGPRLEITASRSLALSDQGKLLESKNGSSEVVLTIPLRGTVNFGALGGRFNLVQVDLGTFTIDPVVGVTLNNGTSSLSLAAQFKGATLYERGQNEWVLTGALA